MEFVPTDYTINQTLGWAVIQTVPKKATNILKRKSRITQLDAAFASVFMA